jgi:hypothetical protein
MAKRNVIVAAGILIPLFQTVAITSGCKINILLVENFQ